MRHLDLGLGVRGLRALEEDLENEDGAVHDTNRQALPRPFPRRAGSVQCFFYVTELAGGELVVEDNELDGGLRLCFNLHLTSTRYRVVTVFCFFCGINGIIIVSYVVTYLFEFAFAYVGGGVRVLHALHETLDRPDTVRISQESQLVQVLACALFGLLRGDDADKNGRDIFVCHRIINSSTILYFFRSTTANNIQQLNGPPASCVRCRTRR